MNNADKLNAAIAAMIAVGTLAIPTLDKFHDPIWTGHPRPQRLNAVQATDVMPEKAATTRQLRRLRDRQLAKAAGRLRGAE